MGGLPWRVPDWDWNQHREEQDAVLIREDRHRESSDDPGTRAMGTGYGTHLFCDLLQASCTWSACPVSRAALVLRAGWVKKRALFAGNMLPRGSRHTWPGSPPVVLYQQHSKGFLNALPCSFYTLCTHATKPSAIDLFPRWSVSCNLRARAGFSKSCTPIPSTVPGGALCSLHVGYTIQGMHRVAYRDQLWVSWPENTRAMPLPKIRATEGKNFLISRPCWAETSRLWAEVVGLAPSLHRWQPLVSLWGDTPLRGRQQPALSWPAGRFLRRPLRGQERWGMTEPGPLLCSLENARAGRNDPLHMWEAEEGFQPPEGEDKRVKKESE